MTTPSRHKVRLIQGTTQRVPFVRRMLPFAAQGNACAGFTNICTGALVLPTDWVDEDYSGCTALMQLRPSVPSPQVLLTLDSANGSITLAGNTLTLLFSPADTSPLDFDEAVGHVEITRPNGDVERHYEITFTLNPEGTR